MLIIAGILVAILAVMSGMTSKPAKAHHVAVVAAPSLAHAFSGGSAAGAGSAVAGGAAVVVLIAVDVKHRFRCSWRRSTWTDGRSDAVPRYTRWRDECKRVKKRSKPDPISVSG